LVSPEPSPTKAGAVIVPAEVTAPVRLMLNLLTPPTCASITLFGPLPMDVSVMLTRRPVYPAEPL